MGGEATMSGVGRLQAGTSGEAGNPWPFRNPNPGTGKGGVAGVVMITPAA